MNIGNMDIFESMGVRTDPSVARPVDRVNDNGFGIGGMTLKGPMIVCNGKIILWDVPQYGKGGPARENVEADEIVEGPGLFEGWTENMLSLFEVLEAPPEILVFGTGAEFSPLPNILRRKLHKLGIQLEIQKTRTAASTYNVLIGEGRSAAAALLPIIPTSARTGEKLDIFGIRTA